MNPIKNFVFICFLAVAPFFASAQISLSSFALSDNQNDFSYLPYWATPVVIMNDGAGFTPVILASRPVMVRLPSSVIEDNNKHYRITESGGYEYYFPDDEKTSKPKQGFKPITGRTFYLETARQGIISPQINYKEFVSMSADEQRELLYRQETNTTPQQSFDYVEANLVYRSSPDGFEMVLTNNELNVSLTFGVTPPDNESEAIAIKYLPSLHSPTQLVKLILDPYNNFRITGHDRYKNINSVFQDISAKTAQHNF